MLYEVAEAAAAPPGDLAPAFDAFEFEGEFGFWEAFEVVDADGKEAVVDGGDLEPPGCGVEAIRAEAYAAVIADVLCGFGDGVGLCEVVAGKGMFEYPVVDVESFAKCALDTVALGAVLDPEPAFPCRYAQEGECGEADEGAAGDLLVGG